MKRKPRVYAFIDSQNLNVSTQKFGWKVDWRRFRKFLRDKYGVTQAYMFIGYVPEFQDMYEFLHDAGYNIVLKPTFDMTRPIEEQEEAQKEERKIKGNIDAELVLWAMKEIKNYDKSIIVSGDGDFYCLAEYLEQQNKLFKILTPSHYYSFLFKPFEKYLEELSQYKHQLAYHDKRSKKRHEKDRSS